MPLNDLSLDELKRMLTPLRVLEYVGSELAERDLRPTFDLSPGRPATITLPFAMPEAPGQATKEDVARLEAKLDRSLAQAERLIEDPRLFGIFEEGKIVTADRVRDMLRPGAVPFSTPSPEAAFRPADAVAEASQREPGEEPPAAGDIAGGTLSVAIQADADDAALLPSGASATVSLATAASDVEVAAEGGGGEAVAAADAPAASAATPDPASVPVPGSASALAASAGGTKVLWTEEEDDRLVAYIVEAVTVRGLTKRAAIPLAAAEIGRPVPGAEFRANRALKDRINGAIFAAATKAAQTETPPEIPSPEAARQDAPPPQADVQGESAEPLTAHLMALPEKDGWTLSRDLDLMELSIAGWPPNEIGLELKVRADLVKARFDLLTGLYTDATGKKCRRFTREDVFAALQRLAGKAA